MSNVKGFMQKRSQLMIPLLALVAVMLFNIIRCIVINNFAFFDVKLIENVYKNMVLSGSLISILDDASELAILAMGMTLVTAASRGQDISVGAAAAISGSVFVSILRSDPSMSWGTIIAALLVSIVVAMVTGAFNGTLVAIFKIQPMIATLILFTVGRSIAYWINGGATPMVPEAHPAIWLGRFIPGVPIPTPIFIVILCGIIFAVVLKVTNLGLYAQSVGSNEKAARLNGINPILIKFLVFIILGVCVAIASSIRVGRIGLLNHEQHLIMIEMDAILAVAIGGNSLGGGKFSMVGSIIGAYVIQSLTATLYAMKVPSTDVRFYKAVVIIAIVVVGSPVIKEKVGKLFGRLSGGKEMPTIVKEGM